MLNYFINMFEGMSLLTAVLLSAGVLLCIAEIFLPKIGFSGFLGFFMFLAGISSYYIDGFGWKYIVGLSTMVMLLLSLAICIELLCEAKGKIHNPDRYKLRTYPLHQDLTSLIGSFATAVTNIDLGGTVAINDKMYYAIANNPISAGKLVEVIGTNGSAIIVREYK